MQVRGVVRETVDDFTVEVLPLSFRGFPMNTMTTSYSEEMVVARVVPVPLGRARVGGETRVVVTDNHLNAIIVVAHSIWSETAQWVRDRVEGTKPKLISAQHLPTK